MADADLSSTRLAVVGGTGPQGRGLASRFAVAGLAVAIGSRDQERAKAAAAEVADVAAQLARTDGAIGKIDAGANADVVADVDIVVVSVPWSGHEETVRELAPQLSDKIVVDCVNPLGFDERGPYPVVVDEGSAAQQAQQLLPDSRVVAAFHHVSAVLLLDPDVHGVDTDVLVLSDDRKAADQVIALAETVPGMRGVFAGRLRNAGQVEALAANLIAINRRYKSHAGIRVTDV